MDRYGKAALAAVLLGAAAPALAQDAPAGPVMPPLSPVTDAMLQDPDPADWLMWRRTLNHWGYSPLDQINRENVTGLRMIWSRGLPEGSQEGTPLVHDGVMFFPNPEDIIQAIDAATGDLLWEYRGEIPEDIGDYLPAHDINRNLAIFENLIIDTSADNHLYALDAATGEPVWRTQIAPYQTGSQQTSGPIVADGKVISGRGCEPEGGPQACVVTAHDARTGAELWRRQTIPAPGEPNYESWGDVPYEDRVHVGTWMVPSFDPDLNLIFVGTSVTGPAPKYQLGGNDSQHLYHNSTLALDADTGEIVWWYQHLVDHWDLDHPFERLIVETEIAPDPAEVPWINPDLTPGETRKVITGIPGKTGIVYTLDAATGEFLWARPTVHQNVVQSIDGATGAVTGNPDTIFTEHGQRAEVCPSAQGGKNWQAGAYSPRTGLMYMPMQNTCAMVTAIPASDGMAGFYGVNSRSLPAPGADGMGVVYAVDASTGRTAWRFDNRAGMMPLIATGGGLVFSGDSNGRVRALDDETGDVLWQVNIGSAVTGYPATFMVDGKQYLAVSTGSWRSALTPDLRPSTTNNLFVFALP